MAYFAPPFSFTSQTFSLINAAPPRNNLETISPGCAQRARGIAPSIVNCSSDLSSIKWLRKMEAQILQDSCSGETAYLGVVAANPRADHHGGMALMIAKCFRLLAAFLSLCVPASAQKPRPAPVPSAKELVTAWKLLAEGNLDGALEAALAGLKSAPSSVEGYDLMGIIYMQQRD